MGSILKQSAVLVSTAVWLIGCDRAPDVHVHVSSRCDGPQAYAIWHEWAGRRLRWRQDAQAVYRAPKTDLESENRYASALEIPRVFRMEPRGALPENALPVFRVEQYAPRYISNRPIGRIRVRAQFAEGEHRRIDVRFGCCGIGGVLCGEGGGAGGPGGRRDPCEGVEAAGNCRPATAQDRQARPPGRVPMVSEFDEGDGEGFDPNGLSEENFDDGVPTCELICEGIREGQTLEPELRPAVVPRSSTPPQARPAGGDAGTPAPTQDSGRVVQPDVQLIDPRTMDVPNFDAPTPVGPTVPPLPDVPDNSPDA